MKNKIKKNLKFIVIIFGITLTFSCCTNNKIEKTLDGRWIIDTLLYRDIVQDTYHDFKYYMGANVIYFENTEIIFPEIPTYENDFTWSKKGTWFLLPSEGERPYQLQINSENEVFNGSHQLWFYKDEKKKVLKMVLFSDKLYLTAGKGWLSYDHNTELINDLIKATEKREGNVDNVP